jgi:hypothetical protein
MIAQILLIARIFDKSSDITSATELKIMSSLLNRMQTKRAHDNHSLLDHLESEIT